MLTAANWTARPTELATRARVPGGRGNLAALDATPSPKSCSCAAGGLLQARRFVLRSHDEEPWVPLSFGQSGDGTPYICLSGRVTPSRPAERTGPATWSSNDMNVAT